jgi:transposase InsO family protein
MHQYSVGAKFERSAIPQSDQGNRYLLIAMDHFTKWSEDCAITKQEASTVAEELVTNFSRFGVPREVHRDQSIHFESRRMQEHLERK